MQIDAVVAVVVMTVLAGGGGMARAATGVAAASTTAIGAETIGIARALASERGDAARGRTVALDRNLGACVLCHALPDAEGPFGNIGSPRWPKCPTAPSGPAARASR